MLTRALVAARHKNGVPVPGIEDLAVGLREIMGDHSLPNRSHLLRLFEVTKEIFDDAPDSGAGRTTVFLFPSEVEAEMKAAAAAAGQQPTREQQRPAAPAGPLAGMEELEEPNA